LRSWKIASTADFDGDGKSDILWQNPGRELYLWQMNGLRIGANGSLGATDTHWHMV
jgi:hypothetical protein